MVYSYLELCFSQETDNRLSELIHENIKCKISVKNVIVVYNFAKLFNLTSMTETTFSYMERCFTMIVETESFLKLKYAAVAKLFGSSDLHTTSELEVYNAADAWLMYSIGERGEFSKKLLSKVRLCLLSDRTLEHLLKTSSSFSDNFNCVTVIKEALYNKESFIRNKSCSHHTHRYCNDSKFRILVCGGRTTRDNKAIGNVKQIDETNFKNVKSLPSLLQKRMGSTAVCVKGEVYVFGGVDTKTTLVTSVEKYSPSAKTWNKVADMCDDRFGFCACAFMNKIFVVGGRYLKEPATNSCVQLDARDCSWKKAAGMKEARVRAACAVFQGRIVVSGGSPDDWNASRTVESYDFDEWSSMPNMIDEKSHHGLVVVKSKLFVVGTPAEPSCEVYDEICQKFVAFKLPQLEYGLNWNKAVSVGSKLFILQDWWDHILWYDVDEDAWQEDLCQDGTFDDKFCCVKVSMY